MLSLLCLPHEEGHKKLNSVEEIQIAGSRKSAFVKEIINFAIHKFYKILSRCDSKDIGLYLQNINFDSVLWIGIILAILS